MTDTEIADALVEIRAQIAELVIVQGAHRALISQHQSALKTVAQIMEPDRNVDPSRPNSDSQA